MLEEILNITSNTMSEYHFLIQYNTLLRRLTHVKVKMSLKESIVVLVSEYKVN